MCVLKCLMKALSNGCVTSRVACSPLHTCCRYVDAPRGSSASLAAAAEEPAEPAEVEVLAVVPGQHRHCLEKCQNVASVSPCLLPTRLLAN